MKSKRKGNHCLSVKPPTIEDLPLLQAQYDALLLKELRMRVALTLEPNNHRLIEIVWGTASARDYVSRVIVHALAAPDADVED
jgi:hypothetical protein